jgi:hypothetical protein
MANNKQSRCSYTYNKKHKKHLYLILWIKNIVRKQGVKNPAQKIIYYDVDVVTIYKLNYFSI